MNNENFNKKPALATTSPTGPQPPEPKSEADYLARQAADAKAALTLTVREIGQGLQHAAGEHPLWALGLAGVAGALVARAISPASPAATNGEKDNEKAPSVLGEVLGDAIKPLIQDLAATAIAMVCRPAAEPEPPQSL